MSTWRKKAIACLPELRQEFERSDLSPDDVFMAMLPALKRAHIDNYQERLKSIYQYAQWCLIQRDKRLWNAAAVAFYEHLADSDETFLHFTTWIPRNIYLEIRDLLFWRVGDDKVLVLDRYYKFTPGK